MMQDKAVISRHECRQDAVWHRPRVWCSFARWDEGEEASTSHLDPSKGSSNKPRIKFCRRITQNMDERLSYSLEALQMRASSKEKGGGPTLAQARQSSGDLPFSSLARIPHCFHNAHPAPTRPRYTLELKPRICQPEELFELGLCALLRIQKR